MQRLFRFVRALTLALAFILALSAGVRAQEEDVVTVPDSPDDPNPQAATVTNNDFEAGNLSGWTTAKTDICTGTGWNAYSGTTASSFFFSVNPPPQGSFAAMSFGNCSSLNTMYQDISLPAGQRHTLSFTIFYYSRNTTFTDPSGGSTSLIGTQGYRVDVMKTTATNELDAVGFAGETNALFKEGTGLQPSAGVTTNIEHAFMRKLEHAAPQDTNDNASDFVLVTPSGATVSGVQPELGSSGPEDYSAPRLHNADVALGPIDCGTAHSSSPNRVTDSTANGINTKTLKIRRTVLNNTGVPVTKLRFRVVHVTTLGTPNEFNGAAQADVRPVTSSGETVTVSAPCVGTATSRNLQGLTLDTPPAQTSGGGLNSSLSAGTITLKQPLQPGQSIDVNFWLAVVTSGEFRYFLNIEAQP